MLHPKEAYFVKNYKKMTKKAKRALSNQVSFANICMYSTGALPLGFLTEFEDRIHWDKLATFGVVTEDIFLKYHKKFHDGVWVYVLVKNFYSQKFFMDNIAELKEYIPIILESQKLTANNREKLRAFYELVM